MYETIERGSSNSSSYRLYFKSGRGPISPFHDIPLFVNSKEYVFNMIVEIPRWCNAKMEIALDEPLNPIKQDTKGGKLRYVPNCFPYHGVPWNYGALPQTLEDPDILDEITQLKGDGDPVDVIEIGQRIPSCGEVQQVKILGALALIDRQKTDWKLISVSVKDELANLLNDVNDIVRNFPDVLKITKEWFQIYKVVAGKPDNEFAFNGEVIQRKVAHQVVESSHSHWKNLINTGSNRRSISCCNITHCGSSGVIDASEAEKIVSASPAKENPHPKDPAIDIWHFGSQNWWKNLNPNVIH